MRRRLNLLWDEAVTKNDEATWVTYRKYSNKLEKLLKKFHINYEKKTIDSKDRSRLHSYINNRIVDKMKVPTLTDSSSGRILTENQEKVEELAKVFQNSFEDPSLGNQDSFDDDSSVFPVMQKSIWFHKEDIVELLSKWPKSTSLSADYIPLLFIKNVVHLIAYPLEHIFNLSYMRSEVPERWKRSFITPIPKKPPFSNPNNYRPVSITSIFARLFEKIMKRHIVEHLTEQQIIPKSQHGFWKGKSIETALLESTNDWTQALDEHNSVHVVYFDFSKAFDKIPIQKLLHKLYRVGVQPRAVEWIRGFLENRTYQVRIDDCFSTVYGTSSGVPQGGVLSPLLFLVYTCDLPNSVSKFGVTCKMQPLTLYTIGQIVGIYL
ncbi:hypothetical protein Y032_1116g3629 [Ancylostoma ceylanicum]|uniref:Reverse transcriptase domain-containing protein n=1 Tax=Ancylostoma ceylanicum TaxID=53326 RepID=A0A016W6J3_9BILA|nr:hypothetical protein Y032_1116g3629 [Ancylostoma ceylanicum]